MSVPLDGNAIAGALGELFAVDVSVAVSECGGAARRASSPRSSCISTRPELSRAVPAASRWLFRLVRGRTGSGSTCAGWLACG